MIIKNINVLKYDQFGEGINISEGGWATDFFLSLSAGLLSLDCNTYKQFKKMICIAFLFGGIGHRYFGNKALDGKGQILSYIIMTLGYIPMTVGYINLIETEYSNKLLMIIQFLQCIFGIMTIHYMSKTKEITDDYDSTTKLTEDEKKAVKYDFYYSSCELLLVILYIYKLIYLYQNKEIDKISIASNLLGYITLYGWGGLNILGILKQTSKNQDFCQRFFHYTQYIFIYYLK